VAKDHGRADLNDAVARTDGAWRIRKRLQALPQVLTAAEEVLELQAARGGRPATGEMFGMGLLVVTDHRLLHVDRRAEHVHAFPLDQVTALARPGTGPKEHTLTITAGGEEVAFQCFDRRFFDRVEAAVTQHAPQLSPPGSRRRPPDPPPGEAADRATSAPAKDPATSLQTLQQLLADNLITEAEYEAKKAVILDRL
jgi:hypothetical protein